MTRRLISEADLSKVRQRFTELEQDELPLDLNDNLSSAPASPMKLNDDENDGRGRE